MADTEQIKELILSSKRLAAADMAAIKAAAPLTKAFFAETLRCYVLHKYMLDPAAELPENFSALTELSLARSMRISPELVKEFDLAKSCDGASSAMAKKVLLFMAIQRELGIELPAMESARLTTLAALAELAWGELEKSPAWEGKLEA
jgi:hypothetical protein